MLLQGRFWRLLCRFLQCRLWLRWLLCRFCWRLLDRLWLLLLLLLGWLSRLGLFRLFRSLGLLSFGARNAGTEVFISVWSRHVGSGPIHGLVFWGALSSDPGLGSRRSYAGIRSVCRGRAHSGRAVDSSVGRSGGRGRLRDL